MLATVTLKPNKDLAVKHGHPWIFSGAIAKTNGTIAPGALVLVLDAQEQPLGIGYANPKSNIRVRMLTRNPEDAINKEFFVKKFTALRAMKESFIDITETDSYRAVFAESDGVPGLIVDKFGDVLVLQAHTAGIDALKGLIVPALVSVYAPKAVYERSDLSVRRLEGLDTQPTGLLHGTLEDTKVMMKEHGMIFSVDIEKGQKTGFFLDQRENRQVAAHYAKGRTCLNVFSYTAGFGVAMMRGGAEAVVNVDASEPALVQAEENYRLNGLDVDEECFVETDAFDAIEDVKRGDFDLILLDPPAFSKTVKDAPQALRAYTKLNAAAIAKLPSGGILITSSCSGAVSEEEFFRSIMFAASKAGATLRLLDKRAQPIDHGASTTFPEGHYLKFFVFVKE